MGRGPAAPYGLIEVAHRNKLLELARRRAQLERRSAGLKMLYQLLLREPQAFTMPWVEQLDAPAMTMLQRYFPVN